MGRFLFPVDPLNPVSKVKVYRFKAVIFGANCSPFHLAAVIVKHLEQEVKDKVTRDTLLRGLYVDNLFQTANSKDELVDRFHKCRQIFSKAGMNLRSWRSDLEELNDLAEEHEILEDKTEIKVLGMLWDTKTSTIKLQAKPKWNGKYCKRSVLSYSNQHYDPLGFIVPIEVKMRIFIQELWDKGFNWEQLFSGHPELVKTWKMLMPEENSCNSELVKAKAKIVGIDKQPKINSIPKLELMAIVMGSTLAAYCIDALHHIEIVTLNIWSDSKTALSWCSSYDKKEEFVSNRVRTIRENVPQAKLLYIESAKTPADILTRKPKAIDLLENIQWWKGPDFLRDPTKDWPVQNPVFNLMPEENIINEFNASSNV